MRKVLCFRVHRNRCLEPTRRTVRSLHPQAQPTTSKTCCIEDHKTRKPRSYQIEPIALARSTRWRATSAHGAYNNKMNWTQCERSIWTWAASKSMQWPLLRCSTSRTSTIKSERWCKPWCLIETNGKERAMVPHVQTRPHRAAIRTWPSSIFLRKCIMINLQKESVPMLDRLEDPRSKAETGSPCLLGGRVEETSLKNQMVRRVSGVLEEHPRALKIWAIQAGQSPEDRCSRGT